MYYVLYDELFEDWNVLLEGGAPFGDKWLSSHETREEAEEEVAELNKEEKQ